jgi:hypothetical protein
MMLIAGALLLLALSVLALRAGMRAQAKLDGVARELGPQHRTHDGNTMPDALPQVVPTDPGKG